MAQGKLHGAVNPCYVNGLLTLKSLILNHVTDVNRFFAVFSGIGSELRESKFAGDEVKHGDKMRGRAVATCLPFGGAENTTESFHEGIG